MKQTVSLIALLGLAGCANVEELGSQRQEIRDGTPVSSDTFGTLLLPGCSGILLRNRWGMTIRHCVPTVGTVVQTRAGATAHVDKVYSQSDPIAVTLFHFDANLVPEGSATTRGPFPLFKGPAPSLVGQTVACQGWGATSLQCHIDPNTGAWTDCSGGGLNSALLPITQSPSTRPAGHPFPDADFATTFKASRNTTGAGQITGPGDSGSTCLTRPSNSQKTKNLGPDWFHEGHLPDDPFALTTQGVWATHYVIPSVFRDWANGIIGGAPTVGLNAGYERTDGTSSVVYRNGLSIDELFNVSGTWGVAPLVNNIAASNPAMYVRPDGYNSVIFRDTSNHIRELALLDGTGNWGLYDLLASAAGDPGVFTRSDEVPQIVFRNTNNHIQGYSLSNGSWALLDLTLDAPGPYPVASTDPIGYVRSDGINAVVYTDSFGQVWELSRAIGDAHWASGMLSNYPATGRVHPYSRSDGVSVVVFRSTATSHIIEMSLNTLAGTGWAFGDLTAAGGGPLTASEPVGYVRADGTNAVVYEASDRTIHEIALVNNTWVDSTLNSACGINAPLADYGSSSAPNAYVRADRVSAVVYRSGSHLWELSLPFGASCWAKKDMTQEAGGF